jgi:hypothetical protein
MYYSDHQPPHFHVRYGEQKAIIDIGTNYVLGGQISQRALNLVKEWAALHQTELHENWELARQQAPLKKIEPLE